ncbi:MAG: EamA family transporter [Holophagaceae bacterium]|nr:EamA family transporter [Holophagaceae bacterium]
MLAWICYAICAVVWGSTYFAIAVGIESFTPFGLVATRFTVGGLLAILLGRILKEPLPLKRDLPHLMLVGALLLSGSNALVTWSESRVSSGVAAIVCALVPVALALWSRETLGARTWIGLALGLLGVGVLTDPFNGKAHAGGGYLLGIGALLLATTIWSYGTLHGKKHIQGSGLITQVGVQMLTAAVIGLVLAPLTGGYTHHPLTLKAGLAALYLGVFGSLIAFSAYIYLAKAWSPAKMGTYAYLNPLVAVLLGSLYLAEPFNLRMAMGMLVILAGVAIVQIRPRSRLLPLKTAPVAVREEVA